MAGVSLRLAVITPEGVWSEFARGARFRYLSRSCGRNTARRAGMKASGMAGAAADRAGGPVAALR